jgi:transposase
MPKKAPDLVCNKEEFDILNKLANGETQKRLIERAKIILFCHVGFRNDEISKKMQITVITVAKWRNRFNKYRVEGLKDKARSGKPRKYDESIRNAILKLIGERAPKGQSCWNGSSIAQHLGVSQDIVWRILRKEGVQLQRKRSCVSTDKELAAKTSDITKLYLTPPGDALVLNIGENSSVQVLERKIGYVET